MEALMYLSVVFVMIIYLWASTTGKKWKARVARIRKVHGADARISYMDLKGKRTTREITIETAKPHGRDWLVTAWCHEKKEFFVFHASRMYEYIDLKQIQEIKNVPAYFTERFAAKSEAARKIAEDQQHDHEQDFHHKAAA
jgi:predicted DNA-binding transcriptional regulator YafY